MPPADRRSAALARLALVKANITVQDPTSSAQKLAVAIGPLYAINWTSSALSIIGRENIRKLIYRLRNSKLGRGSYLAQHSHLTRSLILPNTVTPREWGLWSDLLSKYNLHENATTQEWADLLVKLQVSRIWNPTGICFLHRDEARAVDDAAMAGGRYIILWQAAKFFFEQRAPTTLPLRVGPINKDIDQLLQKFQQRQIEDATIYKDYCGARDSLDLPRNFEDLTPLNRTSALARARGDGRCCRQFIKSAERLNIIRTVQGSLRSVTSGIRSYVRFAAALGGGTNISPPTEATVRAWSCIFKPGRTYQNYLPRLKKACFLLELDAHWDTPSVRTISHGLENSQGRSFAFPNFIFPRTY